MAQQRIRDTIDGINEAAFERACADIGPIVPPRNTYKGVDAEMTDRAADAERLLDAATEAGMAKLKAAGLDAYGPEFDVQPVVDDPKDLHLHLHVNPPSFEADAASGHGCLMEMVHYHEIMLAAYRDAARRLAGGGR